MKSSGNSKHDGHSGSWIYDLQIFLQKLEEAIGRLEVLCQGHVGKGISLLLAFYMIFYTTIFFSHHLINNYTLTISIPLFVTFCGGLIALKVYQNWDTPTSKKDE